MDFSRVLSHTCEIGFWPCSVYLKSLDFPERQLHSPGRFLSLSWWKSPIGVGMNEYRGWRSHSVISLHPLFFSPWSLTYFLIKSDIHCWEDYRNFLVILCRGNNICLALVNFIFENTCKWWKGILSLWNIWTFNSFTKKTKMLLLFE